VILGFLPANDIVDNDPFLRRVYCQEQDTIIKYSPFLIYNSSVEYFIPPPNDFPELPEPKTAWQKIKHFAKTHSRVAMLVSILKHKLIAMMSDREKEKHESRQNHLISYCRSKWFRYCDYVTWGIYTEFNDTYYMKSFDITEKILKKFKKEVEDDNRTFVVVILPSIFEYHNDIGKYVYDAIGEYPPERFNQSYPTCKILEICGRLNLTCIDLNPVFQEYKGRFKLKYPYFSYVCDGHWNPLGHYIAANYVACYLVENNIVSVEASYRDEILEMCQRNLNKSPQEILGSGYDSIFHGGMYRG